jgi:cellulose biosynthesis protein BcsQ
MPTSSSMYNRVLITALSRTKGKKQLLKDLDSRLSLLRPFSFKIDQNEYQTDRHWQNG